jgi:hypothetical protein
MQDNRRDLDVAHSDLYPSVFFFIFRGLVKIN